MLKKELRQLYQEKRKQLTPLESVRLNDLLLIQFQQWPMPDIQTLMSYRPIFDRNEVDTHLMSRYLGFRIPGLRLAFPLIDIPKRKMTAMMVTEETGFLNNDYLIEEPVNGEEIAPAEIDAVFVPLLAYDRKGYRVGYGKGFYDRFLASCREDVIKIGFSYFTPEEAISDINEYDIPLNVCITPYTIYEF